VVLTDPVLAAIVGRSPDPVTYARAILRVFEATRTAVDRLAANLAETLEALYTARFGGDHVPRSDETAELSRIVLDYRELGTRVVANSLDEVVRDKMVAAGTDSIAGILLRRQP